MYILYISSSIFISYIIYNYFFKIGSKQIKSKKLENDIEYFFTLNTVDIYDFDANNFDTNNSTLNKTIYFNIVFNKKENIIINENCNYLICHFTLNEKKYSKLIKNNEFIFPFYKKEQIIDYVYINKITKIHINLDNIENEHIIDITDKLLKYIGPNYDFYCDDPNCLVKDYYKLFNIEYTCNTIMKIYDRFDNYIIYNINDSLKWNPNIIK